MRWQVRGKSTQGLQRSLVYSKIDRGSTVKLGYIFRFSLARSKRMTKIGPPDVVIGMTEWQPKLFNCQVSTVRLCNSSNFSVLLCKIGKITSQISVPCLTVNPKHISFITGQCKGLLLKMPKVQPIQSDDGDKDQKSILFSPDEV